MSAERHAVAELPQFIRDAEGLGLSEQERQAIINAVSADPLKGDEVRGSGGVRKVRFAGRGKGKEWRIPGHDRIFWPGDSGVSARDIK